MNITNRVFVITGAGSGLGAAVARMVVEQHGKAMLLDVNAEAGAALAHELGAAARFQPADVTSETDGQAAIAAALDAFGRIEDWSTARASRRAKRSSAARDRTVSPASRARSRSIWSAHST